MKKPPCGGLCVETVSLAATPAIAQSNWATVFACHWPVPRGVLMPRSLSAAARARRLRAPLACSITAHVIRFALALCPVAGKEGAANAGPA
jgi:hypothetical protein